MSSAVADSGTVQALTSLVMAPKPRLFFLTTKGAAEGLLGSIASTTHPPFTQGAQQSATHSLALRVPGPRLGSVHGFRKPHTPKRHVAQCAHATLPDRLGRHFISFVLGTGIQARDCPNVDAGITNRLRSANLNYGTSRRANSSQAASCR